MKNTSYKAEMLIYQNFLLHTAMARSGVQAGSAGLRRVVDLFMLQQVRGGG